MNISNGASSSFMIANLIATALIVAIHYSSKGSIDTSFGYDVNYIVQEALTNGFARSAVPIFALLSGYFTIKMVATFNEYRLTLLNKFYTLLVPYLIASTILFLCFFVFNLIFRHEKTKQLDLYLIIYNVITNPSSIQFWFLRDLIILVIIAPLLFNGKKVIFYGIGILLFFLWVMNIQPFPIVGEWYFLNSETLFFFWLGGMLRRRSMDIDALIFCKNKTKVILMIFWVGLIAFRVYIDPDIDVWYVKNYTVESILLYKMAIFVGVVSILQVSTIMKNSRLLIFTSGLTFFVYLYHVDPLIYLIKYFTSRIIEDKYSFYLNFPLALFLVFIFAYIAARNLSQFYSLISGGRSPNKALQRTV
jgi:hypothetical protein